MTELKSLEEIMALWTTSTRSLEPAWINPREIPTIKACVERFTIQEGTFNKLKRDMRNGWDEDYPVMIAIVDQKAFLIDGHTRTKVAIDLGIEKISFIVKKFETIAHALKKMDDIQYGRRNVLPSDIMKTIKDMLDDADAKGITISGATIGKKVIMSGTQANRYINIIRNGTEEMIKGINSGEMKVKPTDQLIKDMGLSKTRPKTNPGVHETPVKPPLNNKPKKKAASKVKSISKTKSVMSDKSKKKESIVEKSILHKATDLPEDKKEILYSKQWSFLEIENLFSKSYPEMDSTIGNIYKKVMTTIAQSIDVEL